MWIHYITFTPSRRKDDDALIDLHLANGKLGQGQQVECYAVCEGSPMTNFRDHIKQGKITDEWFQ